MGLEAVTEGGGCDWGCGLRMGLQLGLRALIGAGGFDWGCNWGWGLRLGLGAAIGLDAAIGAGGFNWGWGLRMGPQLGLGAALTPPFPPPKSFIPPCAEALLSLDFERLGRLPFKGGLSLERPLEAWFALVGSTLHLCSADGRQQEAVQLRKLQELCE